MRLAGIAASVARLKGRARGSINRPGHRPGHRPGPGPGRPTARGRALAGLAFYALLSLSGLAACTSQNPEYVAPCTLGERSCAASTDDRPITQVCGLSGSGEAVLIDEPCPLATRCDGGRCAPGVGARPCTGQSECAATEVCTPLVQTAAAPGSLDVVGSYCVPALSSAPAAPGTACQRDADCQSYRCLQHIKGRFCLKACGSDTQCGPSARCLGFNVTITGVQGMVRSCSPL
ncbi:MAG: hypothetical protein U1A78_27845 [Polyangia bacterium]